MQVTHSFSGRRWALADCDEDKVRSLVLEHELPPVLARLLVARGITNGAALDYLNPTLKHLLPEPLTLKNMDKAVARVLAAISSGEKIAVFGDYDVDGSCSAAQLYVFLTAVSAPPRLYIPDRLSEGYGPNAAAMLKLKDEGISLVITVDCGAGALKALTAAQEAGLDVVVLDHHATEHEPPCVAHVNPNAGGDASGLGHLSAAGITFLFLVALNRALRDAGWYASRTEPDLREAVDLVGLATVCDVVPLTGVNRAFVRGGLAKMGKLQRPGLAALARIAAVTPPFTPYHLGFVFGPRINAGGRVGRCSLGVDLLTTLESAAAEEYALALDTHNRERQALEKMILDEAIALAAQQDNAPFLLVSGDQWHPGVVGIVAGRLKDRFAKPSFVAGFEGGLGRGSARSVNGTNVGAIIRAARDAGVLDTGGGHAMAAGFSLRPEQLDGFRAFLADTFEKQRPSDEVVSLCIDALISPSGATAALAHELSRAGPFGAGNAEPVVAVPDAQVVFADVVGNGHVRLRLAGADGARLDGIAFRVADTSLGQGLLAARGTRIHAAGRLRAEEWNGRARVQLHLDDAAPATV
jgi:single-stranded-DNA-specific exonuclease